MQAFVSEYEEKLDELCDKCKQMKQIYNKVLVSKLAKVTWAMYVFMYLYLIGHSPSGLFRTNANNDKLIF